MSNNHEWLACLHNKSNGHIVTYDLNDAYRLISHRTYFNKKQIVIVNYSHTNGKRLLEQLTQIDTKKSNTIIIAMDETGFTAETLCRKHDAHAFVSLSNANKELKLLFGKEFEL